MARNRKKELRNAFHKSYKGRPTIVKEKSEASYTKVLADYDRKSDEFHVTICTIIGGKHDIRISGILDARYFYGSGRGILINTPKHLRTKTYFKSFNCYEVFIKEEDAPNLLTYLKGYVHTIGDMLDDGIYEDDTRYQLMFEGDNGAVKDSAIGDYINLISKTS